MPNDAPDAISGGFTERCRHRTSLPFGGGAGYLIFPNTQGAPIFPASSPWRRGGGTHYAKNFQSVDPSASGPRDAKCRPEGPILLTSEEGRLRCQQSWVSEDRTRHSGKGQGRPPDGVNGMPMMLGMADVKAKGGNGSADAGLWHDVRNRKPGALVEAGSLFLLLSKKVPWWLPCVKPAVFAGRKPPIAY